MLTIKESEDALFHSKKTALGKDRINSDMLTKLNETAKHYLVTIFNKLWALPETMASYYSNTTSQTP